MKNQIKDFDLIIGKTIKSILTTYSTSITIVFTDNTFYHMKVEDGYDGYELTGYEDFDMSQYITDDLIDSGVVSKEEIDKFYERRRNDNYMLEFLQYTRLKSKFEKL